MIPEVIEIHQCRRALADAKKTLAERSRLVRWLPSEENKDAEIESLTRVQLLNRGLRVLEDNLKIRCEVRG